jgi:hypothetical protein
MSDEPKISIKEFKPLNGLISIEMVQFNDPASVWRINAIADNCNLQHYKFLKVGDLIYTGAYCYKMRVGTIQFIRPQDIKAIYPVEA